MHIYIIEELIDVCQVEHYWSKAFIINSYIASQYNLMSINYVPGEYLKSL